MRILVFAAIVSLSACVSAAGAPDQPAPFATAQAPTAAAASYPIAIDVPAGAYRNDRRHSSVLFRIRHQGLAWFTARFNTFTASINLDPADPSRSTLEASIDARSVDTNVLSADGERGFDQTIARALGGDAQPQITFHATAIERTGEHTGRITGDLSMNGQTHPAVLEVTFDGGHTDPLRGGTALGFSAHGTIHRSEWGVTDWSQFAGDEVQIVIEVEFVKA